MAAERDLAKELRESKDEAKKFASTTLNLKAEMATIGVLVEHIETDVRTGERAHLDAALYICNTIKLIVGTYR